MGLVAIIGVFAIVEWRYVDLEEGVVADACEGDLEGVRGRLSRGAKANAENDDGLGALDCAATNGHPEVAALLLASGADPDHRDETLGFTPREMAIKGGDPAMVRLFARYPKR